MKKCLKLLGVIAFVMIIGLSMTGCDFINDNGNGGSGGGRSGSKHVANELARIQREAESHGTYIIEVSADENIAPHTLEYMGAINVTVILRGIGGNRTLRLATNGTMFTVSSNVTFVLDNNITLQGHSQNTREMVRVNNNGIFKMNDGTTITDNNGGGVYVLHGSFEMTGGIISGNTRNVWDVSIGTGGGGIFFHGGSFDMKGGSIFGNTTTGLGGGVALAGCNFNMSGGNISSNNASDGGGVYAQGGTFNMTGGTITNNIAINKGGGVYLRDIDFNKGGGTITGYNSDQSNGNVVRDAVGNVIARRGHAVSIGNSVNEIKAYKDNTVGSSDNLFSTWLYHFSGEWDYL